MWSGGKDSLLALRRARRRGLAVDLLVTMFDAATGRLRFHATPVALIEAQAASLGLTLRAEGTSWSGYDGVVTAVFEDLASRGYAGVVFGDVHLADVRAWYEQRVRAAGLAHIEPIWGEPSAALVAEFVESGHLAILTCVEEGKLDRSWLGRRIDAALLADLATGSIDAAGENGEYHSFVFAGPEFGSPVAWRAGRETREGRFLQLELEPPTVQHD